MKFSKFKTLGIEENCWMKLNSGKIILLFAILLAVFNIFTSRIHVDEGWYHNLAWGQNNFGYPTFPAFHDITSFSGYYAFGSGLIVQMYVVADKISNDGLWSVKLIRFSFFVLFLCSLLIVVPRIIPDNWELITAIILLNPIIWSAMNRGRAEIVVTSFLLLFAYSYSLIKQRETKILFLFVLSFILFRIHSNGVLYFMIFFVISLKSKWKFYYWFFMLFILFPFFDRWFLATNDESNIAAIQQNMLFLKEGNEKVLPSITRLPFFLLREIRGRYLFRFSSSYTRIIQSISILLPVIGYYYNIFFKKIKPGFVFLIILSTMAFFIILGNKWIIYISYIIPLLIIEIFRLKTWNKKGTLITLSLVLITIAMNSSYKGFVSGAQQKEIAASVLDSIPEKSFVYANMSYSPFFINTNHTFYTTSEKNDFKFIKQFKLKEQSDVYLLASSRESFFDSLGYQKIELFSFKNETLYKVEQK